MKIAPHTPPPLNNDVLAAFTMASTPWSFVISPFSKTIISCCILYSQHKLKQLIDAYQDPKNLDKIGEIQKSVDSIKIDMKDNLNKMVDSVENVKDLENKTEQLQLESSQYQKNSDEIRTITWWQNIKLWILLGLIVILLIIIIILIAT